MILTQTVKYYLEILLTFSNNHILGKLIITNIIFSFQLRVVIFVICQPLHVNLRGMNKPEIIKHEPNAKIQVQNNSQISIVNCDLVGLELIASWETR